MNLALDEVNDLLQNRIQVEQLSLQDPINTAIQNVNAKLEQYLKKKIFNLAVPSTPPIVIPLLSLPVPELNELALPEDLISLQKTLMPMVEDALNILRYCSSKPSSYSTESYLRFYGRLAYV